MNAVTNTTAADVIYTLQVQSVYHGAEPVILTDGFEDLVFGFSGLGAMAGELGPNVDHREALAYIHAAEAAGIDPESYFLAKDEVHPLADFVYYRLINLDEEIIEAIAQYAADRGDYGVELEIKKVRGSIEIASRFRGVFIDDDDEIQSAEEIIQDTLDALDDIDAKDIMRIAMKVYEETAEIAAADWYDEQEAAAA